MAGVMRIRVRSRRDHRTISKRNQQRIAANPLESLDMAGSNMWALAPERTKNGNAILLGNPHQPWSREATYYEAHLIVPGIMNFYGSTFIGRPVLTSGFNEQLGWSHTVNYPDLEEIYAIPLDPDRENHFLFDGDSVPLEKQEVNVRFRDGRIVRTESRTYWHTPLGPVIDRDAKNVYVLRSACYDEYRAYVQWLRMSLAKSHAQFRQALEMQAVPMFNICYADREGNIEYLWNGTVPVLPHAARLAEAVPATNSSQIWTRFHSLAELPQLHNPPGGYVQNCNDPFHYTNLRVPMNPNQFPLYFSPRRLGLRTQHCLELIDGDEKWSLEDVRDRKFSQRMLLADKVKGDLIAVLEKENPTGDLAEALQILKRWDNSVSAKSVGSVLFETWWRHYAMEGSGNLAKPIEVDSYAIPWSADQPMTTPHGLGNKNRAVAAMKTAVEDVKREQGRLDVPWGDVHRLRRGDKDLPVGGGSGFLGCFRVLSFAPAKSHRRVIEGGDSWIFAVEFANPPKAYSVLGYSQSSNPQSPHFNDQAELFAEDRMKPVAFTDDEIQAGLLREYHPGDKE
ncbi:MAG: penicillin acylase family protein [Planctomycetota bacterium]